MGWPRCTWRLVVLVCAGVYGGVYGVGAAHAGPQARRPVSTPAPPATVNGSSAAISPAAATGLRALGSRAAVIFAGRVLSVDRNDAAGYVDISFHVEQAVRGCAGSTTYVLREWAGLWAIGEERYQPGRRVLMLLAARGPSGMSAPVGGAAGIIPLMPGRLPPLVRGEAMPPPYTGAEAAGGEIVDLRWVETLATRGAPGSAQSLAQSSTQTSAQTSSLTSSQSAAHADARTRDGNPGSDPQAGWAGPIAPMLRQRVLNLPAGPGLAAVLDLLGTTSFEATSAATPAPPAASPGADLAP